MAIDSNFYKQKQTRGIYFALGFLVLVIVGTGALFFYNIHLDAKNTELKQEISQREASIEELRKDKNIEAYYIYNPNKSILDTFTQQSQIPTFIEHTLRTMIRYDITFEDFSYEQGELRLNAIAESTDKGLAYSKIVKFLTEYNVNEASLFELQPIENFAWQDNIQFPVKFAVK